MLRYEIPDIILKVHDIIYHIWWSGEEWQGVSQNLHGACMVCGHSLSELIKDARHSSVLQWSSKLYNDELSAAKSLCG